MAARIALISAAFLVHTACSLALVFGMPDVPLRRRFVNLLYPLSQLAILAFLGGCFVHFELPWWTGAVVAALAVACSAGNVALFKALYAAERRDIARTRMRLLQEQVELQRAHAEELSRDIAASQESLARVDAELARAAEQLARREAPAASQTLRRAADLVAAGRSRLCEHRVVDALVAGKRRACAEAGIAFDCDLAVPDDLDLPDTDLCAVFANLLDNAIAACRAAQPEQRFVDVTAFVRGGFLVVRVRNGCAAADGGRRAGAAALPARVEGKLPEHGWGTLILASVAKSHGGAFEAHREGADGTVFCATVTLQAEGDRAATRRAEGMGA